MDNPQGIPAGCLSRSGVPDEHLNWILAALRKANRAEGRAVGVSEILAHLPKARRTALEEASSTALGQRTTNLLRRLMTRGLVFSPGANRSRRFYIAEGALPSEACDLPAVESRRTWLLRMIRARVLCEGRAIRIPEIREALGNDPRVKDLSPKVLCSAVVSLCATGDLQIAARGRRRGSNYYLPVDFDPAQYAPPEEADALSRVRAAFDALWADREVEAANSEGRPRGLTTAELRTKLLTDYPGEARPHRNWVFIALLALASGSDPHVRRIPRVGNRSVVWVPAALADAAVQIDDVYASDAERVREAVHRALRQANQGGVHNLPVSAKEVAKEIEADPSLKVSAKEGLTTMLTALAYENLVNVPEDLRRTRRIIRVGRYRSRPHYVIEGGGVDPSIVGGHVALWCHFDEWKELQIAERYEGASVCRLPVQRVARLVRMEADLDALEGSLRALLGGRLIHEVALDAEQGVVQLDANATHDAESLLDDILGWQERVRSELSLHEKVAVRLRSVMQGDVPETWSYEEFLAFGVMLSPRYEKINRRAALISLTERSVRRVPNPSYVFRGSSDARESAESLVETVDARLKMALRWGGEMTRHRALTAIEDLDRVRISDALLEDLGDGAVGVRIGAISCLAFLRSSPRVLTGLKGLAIGDPIPGVRTVALWAYALLGAPDAEEVVTRARREDRAPEVQRFLGSAEERLRHAGSAGWWKV